MVIGAGSWGTALALVLARNQHQVNLWDIVTDHIADLQQSRTNERYLPGIKLPENLMPVSDLSEFRDIKSVVLAMPCAGLQGALTLLQQNISLAGLRVITVEIRRE